MPPIVNQSTSPADALTAAGACGNGQNAMAGVNGLAHAQGRCGYGPRQPFLVISPWSKSNYVDHTLTDQTSVIRFVEDNWLTGQRIGSGSFDAVANSILGMLDFTKENSKGRLILDETTGQAVGTPTAKAIQ
jgi:phospholipase C